MEVGVSKDVPEATGKRAKVPMRGLGDVNPVGGGQNRPNGKEGAKVVVTRTVMGTLVRAFLLQQGNQRMGKVLRKLSR